MLVFRVMTAFGSNWSFALSFAERRASSPVLAADSLDLAAAAAADSEEGADVLVLLFPALLRRWWDPSDPKSSSSEKSASIFFRFLRSAMFEILADDADAPDLSKMDGTEEVEVESLLEAPPPPGPLYLLAAAALLACSSWRLGGRTGKVHDVRDVQRDEHVVLPCTVLFSCR